MKKFLVILCIIGGAVFLYQRQQQAPAPISNPIYVETRTSLNVNGTDFELVGFLEALDTADCEEQSKIAADAIRKSLALVQAKLQAELQAEHQARLARIQAWAQTQQAKDQALTQAEAQARLSHIEFVLDSAQCKPNLSPRDAKLFANEPTFVTYVSIARGSEQERAIRYIAWGFDVETSDKLCDQISADFRKEYPKHKGGITCIRAIQQ